MGGRKPHIVTDYRRWNFPRPSSLIDTVLLFLMLLRPYGLPFKQYCAHIHHGQLFIAIQ